MSSASITGAMAAMAEPPQMPVPALIRLLVFQLSPSALPISAPSPKQVARVKSMTVSEKRPTVSTVRMFRLAPRRTMANFRTFLEVNLMPGAVVLLGWKNALMAMPINRAMTDAPMRWSPALLSSVSSHLAMQAMPSASAAPGIRVVIFFDIRWLSFLLRVTRK